MLSWQRSSDGLVPTDAVLGGKSSEGEPLYIGRTYHEGGLIPGKIVPSHGALLIPIGGLEVSCLDYECLAMPASSFEWVAVENGDVTANAVLGGTSSEGETLFVGRAYCEGDLIVGKIQPSHRCLYIAYGGEEVAISSYEVLQYKEK